MIDPCVRFLHRALPRPRAGSDKLTTAGPGLALNSTCGNGHTSVEWLTPLLSETPLSLLWMRCPRSTLVRGAPSRYRLRRLCLRSTAPRYRNSASVSLFISSRVVPVTCFVRIVYHELPYRDSCSHPVHELLLQNFAIGSRY